MASKEATLTVYCIHEKTGVKMGSSDGLIGSCEIDLKQILFSSETGVYDGKGPTASELVSDRDLSPQTKLIYSCLSSVDLRLVQVDVRWEKLWPGASPPAVV